ncbi:uncharacterized protein LOC122371790 [Amphibalanus amphitrite]|uniref:uncharacterized protein LOC122371790 n=1 Tax=Amphibalanus amphitrite TaxID=1232801 RepID=UPI001C91941B|nr:uncharacterized protein LOC122371790 [Amphibalanus amphitrite]
MEDAHRACAAQCTWDPRSLQCSRASTTEPSRVSGQDASSAVRLRRAVSDWAGGAVSATGLRRVAADGPSGRATMKLTPVGDTETVVRAEHGHLDELVAQLERHGTRSAQLRFGLLLLRNGINKYRYEVFYSGWSEDILVILITRRVGHTRVVTLAAPDSPSTPGRLARNLRHPELRAAIWGGRFRVDVWPESLMHPLFEVARQMGFSVRFIVKKHVTFARPRGLPEVKPSPRQGVSIRPLLPKHVDIVMRHWPYVHEIDDAHSMIHDSIVAGLSAGAFVTEPPTDGGGDDQEPLPADGLACWALVNQDGFLGFLHTLTGYRKRGLAAAVTAELSRLCEKAGYPAVFHSSHASVWRMAQKLQYEKLFPVFLAFVTPNDNSAARL